MGIAHTGIPWEFKNLGMGMGVGGNGNWIDGNGREWECWKPFPHISSLQYSQWRHRIAGLTAARAKIIITVFSYFLQFSFYCNMRLSRLFNVYFNQHLYVFMLS